MTRISVIIPSYEDRDNLRACLGLLAQQTRSPDTIYVIDNGSTDGTAAVARRFKGVTVVNEPVRGIPSAMRRGLREAARSCDIIARLDADSRPATDWLERIEMLLDRNPSVSAVSGPGVFYGVPSWLNGVLQMLYIRPYFALVRLALGQRPLFGSNMAVRTAAWQRIERETHLGRQDIHDDMDLSYHLIEAGPLHYDSSLKMLISARPFASPSGMVARVVMGLRSVLIHWPQQAPWRRYRSPRHDDKA